MTTKLSAPQQKLLLAAAQAGGDRTPFTGGRNAGRVASAWYRTAQSLADRGLVTLRRTGDAQTAEITDAGRALLC
jgi:hypothetical protein